MTQVCPVLDTFFRRCGLKYIPDAIEPDPIPHNVPSMHNDYLIPGREERLLKIIFPELVIQGSKLGRF